MSTPADRTPGASWATEPERSNLWALSAMRWLALTAGRRASRVMLHPIALYFLLANGAARRHSQHYLTRALGRPAGWRDVLRHMHHFAATVLDRVYFLQERFDEFDLRLTDISLMDEPLANGEGAFMVGAHFGSFEAMRAAGAGRGERVAMVMYEENARLLNATLAAIAPKASLHIIALGRIDAMLTLRRWLEDGGVAGLLADRTLPGASARSRTTGLPFLGQPAQFSDGPFRLAAMMRRPVVFMTGIYHGGRDYELRFVPLADFSQRPAGGGAETELMIRRAMERYVAVLEALCREAPYNWFNFFDFWADDADADTNTDTTSTPATPAAPPR